MTRLTGLLFFFLCVLSPVTEVFASTPEELKIKRKEVFEFKSKPVLARNGRDVTIQFEVKDYCDVTVAVEDMDGRIIRHLACGVLGKNAPPPFQRNAKKQRLVWDAKNDRGKYVAEDKPTRIRVSLGLKPSFEKNLFWSPYKRQGREAPIMQATAEGVYVYDGGNGLDFVELYNHDGTYKRTLYPFPSDRVKKVKGLVMKKDPATGKDLPYKPTFLNQTFLTCGNLYKFEYPKKYRVDAEQAGGGSHYAMYNNASSMLAIGGGRVALGKTYLARFATDGSSGGVDFHGPSCSIVTAGGKRGRKGNVCIPPRSAALSPDGKTLYLTAYNYCNYGKASNDIVTSGDWHSFNCVLKMDLAGDKKPELFVGSLQRDKTGKDNKSLNIPASVAVDARGRVYVADYLNNRVQVFAPDGKHLKSIQTKRPAIVCIDAKSQDIYVFRILIHNLQFKKKGESIASALTVFGPYEKPSKKLECPLPYKWGSGKTAYLYSGSGYPMRAAVDGHASPPRVWLSLEWVRGNVLTRKRGIKRHGILVCELKDKKLKVVQDFASLAQKALKRVEPAVYARQRLYVNPSNGKVYVGEGQAATGKSFKDVIEINPKTGRIKIVKLPFDAEDMCFDDVGHAYLRTPSAIVRYSATSWREVPWDYGEERAQVHTSSSSDRRVAPAISGLMVPANSGWHQDGLFVSVTGNLVVGAKYAPGAAESRKDEKSVSGKGGYQPKMYAGRIRPSTRTGPLFHIFNKHGENLHKDAVMGIAACYGVGIDRHNNIYVMSSGTRIWDGKRYHNEASGTLARFAPGKARVVSMTAKSTPIPLQEADRPKRKPEVFGAPQGTAWLEGADWLYGGVGYSGKNHGTGCSCWNARFTLDYFARSFAPELDRYRVAVLDSAGNLILRIGRYGNVDSAGPKSAVPISGDGVGMVHGAYLATHTDRRLFIADPSNDRIFSVKLGYYASETLDTPKEKPGRVANEQASRTAN